MKSTVALFILLLSVWLLSSGIYKPLIIGFGVGSCALVVLIARRMRMVDSEGVPVHLLPRLPAYLPWFVKEVTLANIDVMKRILSPTLSISPEILVVETTQRSDLGRVLYANSITMTPGTVSIEAEDGTITVHAIDKEVADGLRTGEMDRRVTRLEGADG